MVKTIDKILLGILAVLFIGMGGAFITAVSSNGIEDVSSNKQLMVIDTTARTNIATENDFEDEETEMSIIGNSLEKASAAALAYIGEGRVTDSEIADEEGYYEIEITLDNSNEIDVHLDENFNVLSTEYEDEEEDD